MNSISCSTGIYIAVKLPATSSHCAIASVLAIECSGAAAGGAALVQAGPKEKECRCNPQCDRDSCCLSFLEPKRIGEAIGLGELLVALMHC